MAATFGWQGLSLQHPDDWAPVALSGDRRSGYARLASPRALSLQIRWAPVGRESLESALGRYLDRLSQDSRRKKNAFSRETLPEESGLRYRYKGEFDGEGRLFPTGDGRVAFVEAIGDSTTARNRLIERIRDSFQSGNERWAVLGLDFRLPGPLRVEKKEFLAGRTALTLVGRGVRVTAERWGLADSLLSRGSLEDWAGGRLGRGWAFSEEPPAQHEVADALRGHRRALFSLNEVLLKHQPERNQITLLRVQTRQASWRPQWDWLI